MDIAQNPVGGYDALVENLDVGAEQLFIQGGNQQVIKQPMMKYVKNRCFDARCVALAIPAAEPIYGPLERWVIIGEAGGGGGGGGGLFLCVGRNPAAAECRLSGW